jgi:hypothetical protein
MNDYVPDGPCAADRDLRGCTDELRTGQPVVRNTAGEWVLLRHTDVARTALDHQRFSSRVSNYLQIPNGLDGEQHTRYRQVIERYLSKEALAPFVPLFEAIAAQLVADLPRHTVVDAVHDIGAVYAVRAQCAWLGWPAELEPRLLAWMQHNHAATRTRDRTRMVEVAAQFDAIIRSIILPRRAGDDNAPDDVTSRLCRERVDGRLLNEAELVSILRNWTGGDLGSIALCVGVVVEYVASNPELGQRLRSASNDEVEAVIDEILRLDDPFVSNRRVTTCPVQVAGQDIPRGAIVRLNWTSANRDEAVFDNKRFNPESHAAANLVYGAGKHVCPGRLLATWELRIMLRALLASTQTMKLAGDRQAERELPPLGGYRRLPIIFT